MAFRVDASGGQTKYLPDVKTPPGAGRVEMSEEDYLALADDRRQLVAVCRQLEKLAEGPAFARLKGLEIPVAVGVLIDRLHAVDRPTEPAKIVDLTPDAKIVDLAPAMKIDVAKVEDSTELLLSKMRQFIETIGNGSNGKIVP